MEMFLTIDSREKINECKIFMYANKSKKHTIYPIGTVEIITILINSLRRIEGKKNGKTEEKNIFHYSLTIKCLKINMHLSHLYFTHDVESTCRQIHFIIQNVELPWQ